MQPQYTPATSQYNPKGGSNIFKIAIFVVAILMAIFIVLAVVLSSGDTTAQAKSAAVQTFELSRLGGVVSDFKDAQFATKNLGATVEAVALSDANLIMSVGGSLNKDEISAGIDTTIDSSLNTAVDEGNLESVFNTVLNAKIDLIIIELNSVLDGAKNELEKITIASVIEDLVNLKQ